MTTYTVTGNFVFTTLGGREYPVEAEEFQLYDDEKYAYLKPEWTWPERNGLSNGRFERPLEGSWYQGHIIDYSADNLPRDAQCSWQKMDIRSGGPGGEKYLYTYNKPWKASPGISKLITDIRQAVPLHPDPVLKFDYMIFPGEYQFPEYCCPFAVLAGYVEDQADPQWVIFYNIGASAGQLTQHSFSDSAMRAFYRRCARKWELFIDPVQGLWETIERKVAGDYESLSGTSWNDHGAMKILLTIGGFVHPYMREERTPELGAGFTNIEWNIK